MAAARRESRNNAAQVAPRGGMAMINPFCFSVKITPYDEGYVVAADTRATTNFANFARDPASNKQRINTFLGLVNHDLNRILAAPGDCQRYAIKLDILSLSIHLPSDSHGAGILLTEVMRARVLDQQSGCLHPGPTGLNYSSHLRDHDFRVVLPQLLGTQASAQAWSSFGRLHGWLSRQQFGAAGVIAEPLAIAISIAQDRLYTALPQRHPILGRQYQPESASLTDRYFAQMGLQVQFFKPHGLPAPLAFYSAASLLQSTDFYLASLIAVMANFQRIYRPEIYCSRKGFSETPFEGSRASLANQDFEPPALAYDREEREQLAAEQARWIEAHLLQPHGPLLTQWSMAMDS